MARSTMMANRKLGWSTSKRESGPIRGPLRRQGQVMCTTTGMNLSPRDFCRFFTINLGTKIRRFKSTTKSYISHIFHSNFV